jgi:hypothetical protein
MGEPENDFEARLSGKKKFYKLQPKRPITFIEAWRLAVALNLHAFTIGAPESYPNDCPWTVGADSLEEAQRIADVAGIPAEVTATRAPSSAIDTWPLRMVL